MMDFPLMIRTMLYRAKTFFSEKLIYSRDYSGMHKYSYQELYKRVSQLAHALDDYGIKKNEHIGSFGWNNHRHLELYFAVPCSQRVLHTINIRLHDDQLVQIINKSKERLLFVDEDLIEVIVKFYDKLQHVEKIVIMTDRSVSIPTTLTKIVYYEDFIRPYSTEYEFELFDENTPAILVHSSATTGLPKGVLYTHRGIYLHAQTYMMGELGIFESDTVMPIVPMFHASAWGLPYIATFAGANQVYPGSRPHKEQICELITQYHVSWSAGAVTVWQDLLYFAVQAKPYDFSKLRCCFSGGSLLPPTLTKRFKEDLNVNLYQGYGQTESCPTTFMYYPKSNFKEIKDFPEYDHRSRNGLILPGLEIKVIKGNGELIHHDGKEMGQLLVRGPWIANEYFNDREKTMQTFVDGWFYTGDIVTIDKHGYLQVVDRLDDMIKSGGEWISSIDLENLIMSHPAVLEASVIGVPHEKWQERPVAFVVIKEEQKNEISKNQIIEFLSSKIAKWWMPDEIEFISEIPRTTVGKFSKRKLKEDYITQKNSDGLKVGEN